MPEQKVLEQKVPEQKMPEMKMAEPPCRQCQNWKIPELDYARIGKCQICK